MTVINSHGWSGGTDIRQAEIDDASLIEVLGVSVCGCILNSVCVSAGEKRTTPKQVVRTAEDGDALENVGRCQFDRRNQFYLNASQLEQTFHPCATNRPGIFQMGCEAF
ncbi:hypothetical protein BaRGS_00026144 [Batillaria attramentaria]|uniref:Uncharacterized protein n=1 Tax=Batillaria attramentaria TaxID=370345 RepID=A0ABD0K5I4_9CAEN